MSFEVTPETLERVRAQLRSRMAPREETPIYPEDYPPWNPWLEGLPLLVPVALHPVRDNSLFVRDGSYPDQRGTAQPPDNEIYFDWVHGHRTASLKVQGWFARRPSPPHDAWRQSTSTGEITNPALVEYAKPRFTIDFKFELLLGMTAIELLRVVQAAFDADARGWSTDISADRRQLLIHLQSYIGKLTGIY